MHPTQVLDCHIDLKTRLSEPEGLLTRTIREHLRLQIADEGRKITEDEVDKMIRAGYGITEMGYDYRVTHDMCLLVEAAAASLDSTDRWDRTLPPTSHGIVRFDRGLRIQDARGKVMRLDWLLWGPASSHDHTRSGQIFLMFNDHLTNPDDVFDDLTAEKQDWLRRNVGRWGFIGMSNTWHDERVGPEDMEQSEEYLNKVREETGIEPIPSTNVTRYFHALFLLLNQTLVSTSEDIPERAARRRAKKQNIPDRVTVISLRRHENYQRHEGETDVEWQHRWVVRGHWRWQPHGEGRKQRTRIYIAPHIKGPDDKPLIITDKVYNLYR
jgi:hypothetical protein